MRNSSTNYRRLGKNSLPPLHKGRLANSSCHRIHAPPRLVLKYHRSQKPRPVLRYPASLTELRLGRRLGSSKQGSVYVAYSGLKTFAVKMVPPDMKTLAEN